MNSSTTRYAQLYLRLALGIGFIYPVLDRFGVLGPAGQNSVGWGSWQNFQDYTFMLLPFLGRSLSDVMAWIATFAEAIFGVLLIIGFQTRLVALGSFALTALFALSMAFSFHIKEPFNYSVFAASAGALLLSCVSHYSWSADSYHKR
ncbi:MAG: DoxX family membrane protein [Cyclobacteriaceae bacterium]|nr:DoxX family membrane protein [Cyclobacteriaceae bacterium]